MGTVYTTRLFLPFLTHGRFVSLRNSILVSNNTIKTDYTEIDRKLGIEICLSNDSKSVVRF